MKIEDPRSLHCLALGGVTGAGVPSCSAEELPKPSTTGDYGMMVDSQNMPEMMAYPD